jgi:PAS domain-containing protein
MSQVAVFSSVTICHIFAVVIFFTLQYCCASNTVCAEHNGLCLCYTFRVLERYPSNGKVLKVYGRFLEFVRNEPGTAAKYYTEALKHGTSESMVAMTGQARNEALTAAVGAINEKIDGLIIINAQGIILMINPAALSIFGYDKGELEGKNVSVLM